MRKLKQKLPKAWNKSTIISSLCSFSSADTWGRNNSTAELNTAKASSDRVITEDWYFSCCSGGYSTRALTRVLLVCRVKATAVTPIQRV